MRKKDKILEVENAITALADKVWKRGGLLYGIEVSEDMRSKFRCIKKKTLCKGDYSYIVITYREGEK